MNGSFKQFFREISEKPYNFKINLTKDEINELDKFRQLRHIYVHGDGKVDLIYLSKTKDNKVKIGEQIPITKELIDNEVIPLLFNIIEKMDRYLLSIHPEVEYKHKE